MKKLLSMLLASVMLVAIPCQGASIDWASMSDSELQDAIDSARTELLQRKQREENGNLIVCDAEGVQISFTGDLTCDGDYLRLDVLLSNNSGRTISTHLSKAYVNGWDVASDMPGNRLDSGKKDKGRIWFSLGDSDVSDISEIEDVTFSFTFYDSDTYDDIYRSPEIQVFLSEDRQAVQSVQEVIEIG